MHKCLIFSLIASAISLPEGSVSPPGWLCQMPIGWHFSGQDIGILTLKGLDPCAWLPLVRLPSGVRHIVKACSLADWWRFAWLLFDRPRMINRIKSGFIAFSPFPKNHIHKQHCCHYSSNRRTNKRSHFIWHLNAPPRVKSPSCRCQNGNQLRTGRQQTD